MPREKKYIEVVEETTNRVFSLLLEGDGTLLLHTLSSQVKDCSGLKYKYFNDTNNVRTLEAKEIRPDLEGKLHLPSDDTCAQKYFDCIQEKKRNKDLQLKCTDLSSCTNQESFKKSLNDHFGLFATVTKAKIKTKERTGHFTINYNSDKSADIRPLLSQPCTIDDRQYPLEIKYKNHGQEKFSKRPGTTNKGHDYENLLTAYLVLKLVKDEKVRNFYVSSNNNEFGEFDDIVVEVEDIEGSKFTYALQLKYSNQDKTLQTEQLCDKSGNYSFEKYLTDVESLKLEHLDKTFEDCKWILFTNRKFEVKEETLIKAKNEEIAVKINQRQNNSLLEHYFNGNTYGFCSTTEKGQDFFQNFYLYTDQPDVEQVEEEIRTIFKEVFHCDHDPFPDYYNFIVNWATMEGKKKLKLNKLWMKELITLCLLTPFIQPLCNEEKEESAALNHFRKVLHEFDVSVFKEVHSSKLQQLLGGKKILEKDHIAIEKKFQLISNSRTHTDVTKGYSVIMWLTNQCPLIVKNHPQISDAIDWLEDKKYVILLAEKDLQISEKFSTFRSLADLKQNTDLYQETINLFFCSLQGKPEIQLKSVIGEGGEIEKEVKTDQLLAMLQNSLSIGDKEEVPKEYVALDLTKHIINNNFLEKASKDAVILITCWTESNVINVQNFNMVPMSEVFIKNMFTNKPVQKIEETVYFTHEVCSNQDFNKFCMRFEEECKIHQFRLTKEGNLLEWVQSRGGVADLFEFQEQNSWLNETELFNNAKNLNLVVGEPGMGKSTLMKKLKCSINQDSWTIIVSSKDHFGHFNKKRDSIEDFKSYLLKRARETYSDFDYNIFAMMLRENRVNFIWDGLDEISESTLCIVLNVITQLSQQAVQQWITSRSILRRRLENEFSILATNIKQFNETQQKEYISKRLSEGYSETIFAAIKSKIDTFNFHDILGIPLQIYMFTELIRKDPKQLSKLIENIFSPADLYEHFLEEKYNFLFAKIMIQLPNKLTESVMEPIKLSKTEYYENVASKTYLINELKEPPKVKCDSEDPFGIITNVSIDGMPTFLHNSYGEYFAAKYLSKKYKEIPNLSSFIFKEEFKNIRFFFDLILAKDCPTHIAVLCKNFKLLINYEYDKVDLDQGGRTPMHLLCSWGERYNPIEHTVEEDEKYVVCKDKIFTKAPKDDEEYKQSLIHLLKSCDPDEKDQLYEFNCYMYADRSFCLLPLTILPNFQSKILNDELLNFKEDKCSLFCYAAMCDFPDVLSVFKNTPRVITDCDKTLLHLAVYHNSLEFTRKFLSENSDIAINREADVNCTDKDGRTPLHLVCFWDDDTAMAQLLIDSGANINVQDNCQQSPLHSACIIGKIKIAKLLINGEADVNCTDKDGRTPLHSTCFWHDDTAMAQLLIDGGANINVQDNHQLSLLHSACVKGHTKIAKLLIRLKPELIDLPNNQHQTPLHLTCWTGHSETADLLIQKGADVNAIDHMGRTPLHAICYKSHFQMTKLLVTNGAKVNISDRKGRTPLNLAYRKRAYEVVQLMSEARGELRGGYR